MTDTDYTTIPPPSTGVTTTTPSTAPPTTTAAHRDSMPVTGGDVAGLAWIALAFIVAGLAVWAMRHFAPKDDVNRFEGQVPINKIGLHKPTKRGHA